MTWRQQRSRAHAACVRRRRRRGHLQDAVCTGSRRRYVRPWRARGLSVRARHCKAPCAALHGSHLPILGALTERLSRVRESRPPARGGRAAVDQCIKALRVPQSCGCHRRLWRRVPQSTVASVAIVDWGVGCHSRGAGAAADRCSAHRPVARAAWAPAGGAHAARWRSVSGTCEDACATWPRNCSPMFVWAAWLLSGAGLSGHSLQGLPRGQRGRPHTFCGGAAVNTDGAMNWTERARAGCGTWRTC